MILIWLLAVAAASLAGHLVIQAWARVQEKQAEQKND
jgi:hypothetical protein